MKDSNKKKLLWIEKDIFNGLWAQLKWVDVDMMPGPAITLGMMY